MPSAVEFTVYQQWNVFFAHWHDYDIFHCIRREQGVRMVIFFKQHGWLNQFFCKMEVSCKLLNWPPDFFSVNRPKRAVKELTGDLHGQNISKPSTPTTEKTFALESVKCVLVFQFIEYNCCKNIRALFQPSKHSRSLVRSKTDETAAFRFGRSWLSKLRVVRLIRWRSVFVNLAAGHFGTSALWKGLDYFFLRRDS